jgi:hypothetical protein
MIDARFVYLIHELQLFGFVSTDALVTPAACDELAQTLAVYEPRNSGSGGLRNLLDIPEIKTLVTSGPLRVIAEAVLGSNCFAVRGILFDKVPSANWKIGWHQDTIIAVREKRDAPGYCAWSEKVGVVHVQPPDDVLKRMVSIRLHLDTCGEDNAPLRVLSGSHRHGIMNANALQAVVGSEENVAVACTAERGSMLVLKPLLLHASSPAASPSRRRVIHLDFAAEPLPGGMQWHWEIGPETFKESK